MKSMKVRVGRVLVTLSVVLNGVVSTIVDVTPRETSRRRRKPVKCSRCYHCSLRQQRRLTWEHSPSATWRIHSRAA